MNTRDRLSTGFSLGVLAYLGFYVFGLVMGVYSVTDVPYFTIPAILLALAFLVHIVRGGRKQTGHGDDAAIRESRHLREERGF